MMSYDSEKVIAKCEKLLKDIERGWQDELERFIKLKMKEKHWVFRVPKYATEEEVLKAYELPLDKKINREYTCFDGRYDYIILGHRHRCQYRTLKRLVMRIKFSGESKVELTEKETEHLFVT